MIRDNGVTVNIILQMLKVRLKIISICDPERGRTFYCVEWFWERMSTTLSVSLLSNETKIHRKIRL